jgi:hypothetical protein
MLGTSRGQLVSLFFAMVAIALTLDALWRFGYLGFSSVPREYLGKLREGYSGWS